MPNWFGTLCAALGGRHGSKSPAEKLLSLVQAGSTLRLEHCITSHYPAAHPRWSAKCYRCRLRVRSIREHPEGKIASVVRVSNPILVSTASSTVRIVTTRMRSPKNDQASPASQSWVHSDCGHRSTRDHVRILDRPGISQVIEQATRRR